MMADHKFSEDDTAIRIRAYVYLHVLAIALTGLSAYLDRVGVHSKWHSALGPVSMACLFLFLVLPVLFLTIIFSSRISVREKFYVLLVAVTATYVHMIAALPLVQ